MNTTFLTQLNALGIGNNNLPAPGGSYTSVNVRGNVAYVAIQFPIIDGNFFFLGKLGKDISTDDGYKAARISAGNVLLQIDHYVGIERVLGLNHIDVYYQADPGWDDAPYVANGASDLFNLLLKDRGTHTRAIVGVYSLPRGFCVGITASFTLM
jgi:enamine deaminase RidA (YjgF/YER057c/UK114 family)